MRHRVSSPLLCILSAQIKIRQTLIPLGPLALETDILLSLPKTRFPCLVIFALDPFPPNLGLGLHIKRAHPTAYDDLHVTTFTKARWSSGTKSYRPQRGRTLNHLQFFKNRTDEAIKKARQRNDYRVLVEDHPATLRNIRSSAPPPPPIRLDLTPAVVQTPHLEALLEITVNAEEKGRLSTALEIGNFIISKFPIHAKIPRQLNINDHTTPFTKRKKRRLDYARIQNNFRKHQGRCIKEILQDNLKITFTVCDKMFIIFFIGTSLILLSHPFLKVKVEISLPAAFILLSHLK